MIHSFIQAPRVHKTVRQALSGAAMSLALAALSSAAQAQILMQCNSDLTSDFSCGLLATATGSSSTTGSSTGVGDFASATGGTSTAIGGESTAAAGATAVGATTVAGTNSVAVGSDARADDA